MFENIVALPGSGRDATTAFLAGTGDVLLSYENEAILARQNGEAIDYVVPDETLLIENPGAVLIDADPKAQDWLDFVLGPEGRPSSQPADSARSSTASRSATSRAPTTPGTPSRRPTTLLTIDDDFGGWPEANAKYFDPDDGLVTAIQTATGKSS